MSKNKISAKPRETSKASLSPRGKATKKAIATSAANRAEIEKLVAFLCEEHDFKAKECGGRSNLETIVKIIQGGSDSAREMQKAVETGDATIIAEALRHQSPKRYLDDVLFVLESPYYLERGKYSGWKMPTLESAWQSFEDCWHSLLYAIMQRFPAFAEKTSEVQLLSKRYGDRCDRRNLRTCGADERARELGAAHEEFENLELRIIPLFDAIAAAVPSLAENDNKEPWRKVAREVNRRISDEGYTQDEAIENMIIEGKTKDLPCKQTLAAIKQGLRRYGLLGKPRTSKTKTNSNRPTKQKHK